MDAREQEKFAFLNSKPEELFKRSLQYILRDEQTLSRNLMSLIHDVEFLLVAVFLHDEEDSREKFVEFIFDSVRVGVQIGFDERNSAHTVRQ